MESMRVQQALPTTKSERCSTCSGFQMPVNYPRYTMADYEKMPEWKLDCLFAEYGLPMMTGDLAQKRNFAMGAFLWTTTS